MREMVSMVGGCCVCSDEQGWNENPLVYCDGQGCTVAVHQACYGIVSVPSGPWYCRKCESQERAARVRCELCPNKDGALKRTDNGGWAHVVCALYIPEVRFGNVATMEPIILALVPQERFNKVCYLCLEKPGKESKASHGACMQCNKPGCKDAFHVTCAQAAGLLCEEAGNYMDNVKYCGYCDHHFQKINKKLVKTIPAFRPTPADTEGSPTASPDKVFTSLLVKDSTQTGSNKLNSSGGSNLSSTNSSTSSSSSTSQCSNSSKGKGKRGRKSGSMIYEPKLEPPKFNPDLSSLNSSTNSITNNSTNSNSSVTLTPVSSNFNNLHVKGPSSNSFSNCDGRQLNDRGANNKGNIVVKIGKHGEVHHAKKDHPHENSTENSEAILERVSDNSHVKEEIVDKKGFTSANFSEPFVPGSTKSVATSLMLSEKQNSKIDTTKVKLESPETLDAVPDQSDSSRSNFRSTFPNGDSGLEQSMPPSKSDNHLGSVGRPGSESNNSDNSYTRTSLHSSVSLFPTNSSSNNVSKHDSNLANSSSVSIIPSSSSHNSSSSLTVTQVPGFSMSSSKESVTISSIHDDRLTLETLSQSKNGAINNSQAKSDKVGNGLGNKKVGRPPKKGTATTQSSWGNVVNVDSEGEEDSPGRPAVKRKKLESDIKEENVTNNGETDIHKFMMFGATLNPSSGMAKEMSTVLQNEVAAHSVYTGDKSSSMFGVPLPGRRRTHESGRSAPHAVAGMLDPARQPQTLEELLERHWEQGSRFLMEQASHFDIASLLSSLHQLKEENFGLEDSIDRLIARRDHLLAVRARLLALNSLTQSYSNETGRKEPSSASSASSQNGPTSSTDRRLVSPGRGLVSPLSRDKALPSPRDRSGHPPPLPSPRDRARDLTSPRDPVSPRLHVLPPAPHHLENGLDSGPYHRSNERLTSAQLLSVAQQSNSQRQSPVSVSGPPPKAHYPPHMQSQQAQRHPQELRGHYPPTNFQMVSPPPPPKSHCPPLPSAPVAHSSHYSRGAPGMRSTPPGPPPPHHGLPPDVHQQLIRASPQSAAIHLKK